MPKKKRTKAQKKRASTRHQVTSSTVTTSSTTENAFSLQTSTRKVSAPLKTKVAKTTHKEENTAEKILGYPLPLVYQDLLRTIIISVVIIGALIALAWFQTPLSSLSF